MTFPCLIIRETDTSRKTGTRRIEQERRAIRVRGGGGERGNERNENLIDKFTGKKNIEKKQRNRTFLFRTWRVNKVINQSTSPPQPPSLTYFFFTPLTFFLSQKPNLNDI